MKLRTLLQSIPSGRVAPRRGAWIETGSVPLLPDEKFVAPRRGAWIETFREVVTRDYH